MEGQDSSTVEVTDSLAVRRTRREKKKRAGTSALEKIKRSRETGIYEHAELEQEEQLFDYVNDREYAKIVQNRQEEGFILDDDGSYCEHGREIFDEEVDEAKKHNPKKKGVGPRRVARPSANIKHLLMKGKSGEKKKKREEVVSVKEDDLLSDLLSQYQKNGSSSTTSTSRHKKRSSYESSSITPKRRMEFTPRISSTPQSQVLPRKSRNHSPMSRGRFARPSSSSKDEGVVADNEVEEVEVNDGDDMEWGTDNWEDEGQNWEEIKDLVPEETTAGMEVEQKVETKEEAPPVDVSAAAISDLGWETVREEVNTSQEVLGGVNVNSTLPTCDKEGTEVLPFFWLDAYEDWFHQPGTVFLFGKVWAPEANSHVSCCVTVRNIERCLYFLPREKVLDKQGKPTEEVVTFESLYKEVNSRYADRHRILRFTSKRVSRKYSFEKGSVPHESEYLQVRYSAEYPAPQMGDSGRTFSHVFGTNTSSLERLILGLGLKGPCWLNVKQPMCPANPVSWCKCEAMVNSMNAITMATEQAPPPPLVIMSLSLKITLNPKTGTNEVLCLGSLVHNDIYMDKPSPKTLFKADLLAIRRPADRDFPFKFDEHVKRKGLNVEVSPSERAMLGYFLAKLHRLDPDIIVGHNLTSFGLEVLQHRMSACCVPQWSRVGRLKRKDMPKGRMVGQLLCAGRPVVDVMTTSKELIRAKSYDLGELASEVLQVRHKPMDHNDVLRAFCSNEHLCTVISHTMNEAMLSLRIMYELSILPLAYQITCIAGNTLGRTLHGGRAERNEFLLLHAFTTKDYICPDKKYGQKKGQQNQVEDGEGDTPVVRGKRKPAYSGGLVLEPKRGFYDRFILLLDFNSLYPSIIQEYNICFTTVDHAHCPSTDDETYAGLSLPDPSEPLGILPSEIRVLVERRKQVKQLMKSCRDNLEMCVQYDIRQKALKLMANSMYGCLGFPNSRFYAKPLAALITSKGREILSHTKELALKLNLEVIYGDTDSIMINSNTRDLKEAEEIAQRVKTEVNKLYRLLEIDIDGIYKAMLLLRKKKYAAVAVEKRDGQLMERRELKGLDIVRRDWSGLAKICGHYALDQILSGAPLDDVIERIQSFLQEKKKEIETDKVPLEDYIITKSLTKPPSDYPDKKSQPHVQVALRMQTRHQHVQAGDVIPYIMCQGDSHQPSSLRAFHPEEIRKQSHLMVDKNYYLQHQVHAVVSRLCEPIQGLEPARLAECLGMDPSSYRSACRENMDGKGEEEGCEDGRVIDPFEGTVGLFVTCPKCHLAVEVGGSMGLSCTKCKSEFSPNKILNHLILAVRSAVTKYYLGWLVCDDQSCGYRTRLLTVCLEDSAPQCRSCHQGKLVEEYPASALYKQLLAFNQLFTNGCHPEIRKHLDTFLNQNKYSKIDLQRLFPKLN